jgi:hypothetical protein
LVDKVSRNQNRICKEILKFGEKLIPYSSWLQKTIKFSTIPGKNALMIEMQDNELLDASLENYLI